MSIRWLIFREVIHFYYSVSALSNHLKYLPGLFLGAGRAAALPDINNTVSEIFPLTPWSLL